MWLHSFQLLPSRKYRLVALVSAGMVFWFLNQRFIFFTGDVSELVLGHPQDFSADKTMSKCMVEAAQGLRVFVSPEKQHNLGFWLNRVTLEEDYALASSFYPP
ncbi:hypothetical protein BDV33DRAFT_211165 [Aspergillus novoparasiticus]|uniref:Uncharacterized protein n=1 Tax=Aspergillus novoparasiticus TaxID=986946 RepID=A0A5N6E671_9EURO|nr:hypothetical protein BDV33DRAFT_211165 [Aspergillus novoparasiticus]